MSFIANKRTLTKVAEKYYKHRAEWALNLDPFNDDVDIIDCNPNGIHGITYIEPIDAVTFFYTDENEVRNYLIKLLHGEAFDNAGLIYGMGHAVYSISDPRARIFKGFVEKLSEEKGRMDEFRLYSMVERLAPEVIAQERRIYKGVSANVDFYSGFVYSMLDLPQKLFTPLFAIARIAGWSAHRIEELVNQNKIIRPAYINVHDRTPYIDIKDR